jgi:hypothetical protein
MGVSPMFLKAGTVLRTPGKEHPFRRVDDRKRL